MQPPPEPRSRPPHHPALPRRSSNGPNGGREWKRGAGRGCGGRFTPKSGQIARPNRRVLQVEVASHASQIQPEPLIATVEAVTRSRRACTGRSRIADARTSEKDPCPRPRRAAGDAQDDAQKRALAHRAAGYDNPVFNELADRQLATFDAAERQTIVDRMQKIIADDFPVRSLYSLESDFVFR